MAYDYTLALPAEPLGPDFATLLSCFAQRVGLHLYVVEGSASQCCYAFESTLRSEWPEDFAVSAGCLHEAGASAFFEEL